jgi:hypothetical protein
VFYAVQPEVVPSSREHLPDDHPLSNWIAFAEICLLPGLISTSFCHGRLQVILARAYRRGRSRSPPQLLSEPSCLPSRGEFDLTCGGVGRPRYRCRRSATWWRWSLMQG